MVPAQNFSVISDFGGTQPEQPLLHTQPFPEILNGKGHGENTYLFQSELPCPLVQPSLQTVFPHLALRPHEDTPTLKGPSAPPAYGAPALQLASPPPKPLVSLSRG